jgi:hypothetical protein
VPDEIVAGLAPEPPPLNEAALMQNAALGAVFIWRFVLGYWLSAQRPAPMPLCFVVLPILLHHASRQAAIGTNKVSGLRKFASKFDDRREELLAIHERMLRLRILTLKSISVAVATKLVSIDVQHAGISPVFTKGTPNSTPERIRPMVSAATKLGDWCSHLTLHEISSTLRISF